MNITAENRLVESILHMIVNAGEQSNYPEKTRETLVKLANEHFDGSENAARMYIGAQLTNEVFTHADVYDVDAHQAMDVVEDMIGTLNAWTK